MIAYECILQHLFMYCTCILCSICTCHRMSGAYNVIIVPLVTGPHVTKKKSCIKVLMYIFYFCLEMPRNTQKLCTGCNTLISVAFKTCPLCKQQQPYKAKVAARRCKFQNKKAEWKKSIKKNNNRTVVLNSSHVLVSLGQG